MIHRFSIFACLVVCVSCRQLKAADDLSAALESALRRSGSNRGQIQHALNNVPDAQKEGVRFLVAYMPDRDLQSLSADYLLENVRLSYEAWEKSQWKSKLPKDVVLNNVLPFASINERRDNWRKQLYDRCRPLVKDARSPAQAAAILNQKIFPLLKVRYSTKRRKADQSPLESIDSGLASCSGLAVLLIDACRSVGVPARFVGTPLWSDKSGNHSWVEIWDDGWHFTGAAEPTGDQLDRAWFMGRASKAQRDDQFHAIYAVSFKPTPIHFPFVWDPRIKYVSAVNVTDRYTQYGKKVQLPKGHVHVMFRVLEHAGGDRQAANHRRRWQPEVRGRFERRTVRLQRLPHGGARTRQEIQS